MKSAAAPPFIKGRGGIFSLSSGHNERQNK
jgi:hypothetical protein